MEITLEKTDSLTASIKITLNQADYQDRVEKKIKEHARTAHIKGFRPGKVPAGMIRKMYGKSIKVSEVSATSTEALENYLKEQNIQILGGPMMSEATQNGNYDWDSQTDFEFCYDIGLKPEITLSVNKNIVINKTSAEVTDEQVNEMIANLRNMHANLQDLEEVTDQPDVAVYGFVVTANGEAIKVPRYNNPEQLRELFTADSKGYAIIRIDRIGEHKSLFLGKKKNDTVTFDLRTLFPTDAQVSECLGLDEDVVKGISGEFVITIGSISVKQLPELNQEFFDEIFGSGKVEGEEDFRRKLRDIKKREVEIAQKDQMLNQFQTQLLAAHNFELPDSFMKRWLAANNPNLTEEQVTKYYEGYRDTMRFDMLVAELAKAKDIKVDVQDVIDRLSDVNFMQMIRMGYYHMVGMENMLAMRMLQNQEDSQKVDDYFQLTLLHKVFDAYMDEITVQ